jgi:hypothetical protein
LGGRPKRKAAPEGKIEISEVVAGNHGGYICRLALVCQEKID